MDSEIVSEYGLRADGRKPNELREIEIELGIIKHARGSGSFRIGNTQVLAAIYGPHAMTDHRSNTTLGNKGLVTCTFKFASFATSERKNPNRADHRANEISASLLEVLNSIIILSKYSKSQFDVHVEAIQADGSVFAAAINAISVALLSSGIACRDTVSACSLGFFNDEFLADTNNAEEMQSNMTQMTLAVLRTTKQSVAMETTGRISTTKLTEMTEKCEEYCKQISERIKDEIVRHLEQMQIH